MSTQESPLANTRMLIAEAYSAFNRRDIDGALALMSENVSWPRASEGGRVVGKEEIRAYWTRQWKEFDPHVEPVEVIEREGGQDPREGSPGCEDAGWRGPFRYGRVACLHDCERPD